jgi:hypothetical protein
MSHFAEMKVDVQVKNEKDLVASLQAVFGEDAVTVVDTARQLKGMDSRAKKMAHIIVSQQAMKKIGPGYNEMGFERQADGTYKFHVDGMDFNSRRRDSLFQSYAENVATRKLKAQGYKVKRVVLENGDFELTASKN